MRLAYENQENSPMALQQLLTEHSQKKEQASNKITKIV
jgi:hypothetical protein